MADWSFPELGEIARARLEGAGFTPESVGRARPSELVKRAGLRADLARRLIAHYRGGAVENGEGSADAGPASPTPGGRVEGDGGEGREWERVWQLGSTPARGGVGWRGRVVLRVTLLSQEDARGRESAVSPPRRE